MGVRLFDMGPGAQMRLAALGYNLPEPYPDEEPDFDEDDDRPFFDVNSGGTSDTMAVRMFRSEPRTGYLQHIDEAARPVYAKAPEAPEAPAPEMPDFSDVVGGANSFEDVFREEAVRPGVHDSSVDPGLLGLGHQGGGDYSWLTKREAPVHDPSVDPSLLGLKPERQTDLRDASVDTRLLKPWLKPEGSAGAAGSAPAAPQDYSWLLQPQREDAHPDGPMGAARIGPPTALADITAREVSPGLDAFEVPGRGTTYRSTADNSILAQDPTHNFAGRGDINAAEYAGLRSHAFQPDTSAPDISLAGYIRKRELEADANRAALDAANLARARREATAPNQLELLGAEYGLRGQENQALQQLRNQGAIGQLQFKAQLDAQRQEQINQEIGLASQQMAPLQRELAALNADPKNQNNPVVAARRAELETQLKQLQGILNTRLAALLPHPQGSDDVGKLWDE